MTDMQREPYEDLEIEVIEFENEDIITDSTRSVDFPYEVSSN